MLQEITITLFNYVAGFLGGTFLLRFWMQAIHVRRPNTFGDFIFALTDWLVKPLRRVIPGFRGLDWASLLGACLIALLFSAAVNLIFGALNPEAILVGALGAMINWAYYGLLLVILLQVAISWINPYAPQAGFINSLTAPLLRPIRRVVPLIGNVDISPMILMFLVYVVWRVAMQLLIYL
ncbi:MAG: YggT family protein [Burkholderiaceae bacterium]|nr:YggT family protein [Burkholderiaceae bacterium]